MYQQPLQFTQMKVPCKVAHADAINTVVQSKTHMVINVGRYMYIYMYVRFVYERQWFPIRALNKAHITYMVMRRYVRFVNY